MIYKTKILILSAITLALVGVVFFIRPIAQDVAYHNFADKRTFWGISNCLNVVTNLPFLFIGFYGFRLLKESAAEARIKIIYGMLFAGIFLTGIGSAYYHYSPDNNSLVYDRIPMTLVFMSFLSAIITEFVSRKWGILILLPLLFAGVASVLWWNHTELQGAGDLRWYGLVQFYSVISIPLVLWLFPKTQYRHTTIQLVWVVLWYLAAKVFEKYDRAIFTQLHFISGHSLKHLAAAMSAWYLVRMFKQKHINSQPDFAGS